MSILFCNSIIKLLVGISPQEVEVYNSKTVVTGFPQNLAPIFIFSLTVVSVNCSLRSFGYVFFGRCKDRNTDTLKSMKLWTPLPFLREYSFVLILYHTFGKNEKISKLVLLLETTEQDPELHSTELWARNGKMNKQKLSQLTESTKAGDLDSGNRNWGRLQVWEHTKVMPGWPGLCSWWHCYIINL